MNNSPVLAQIFWVTASRVLSRGSLLAASIIFARTFDVQTFAAFSYFLLTISMLAIYASMGLGVTANRYFVGADNIDAQQSRTVAAMVTISAIFSIILACAVLFMPEKLLVGELSIPRWAMVFGALAFSLEVIPQNAMNGLEKYRQDALLFVFSGGVVIDMAVYQSIEFNFVS